MACCLVQKVWKIEEKEEAENIFVQLLKDKVKRVKLYKKLLEEKEKKIKALEKPKKYWEYSSGFNWN